MKTLLQIFEHELVSENNILNMIGNKLLISFSGGRTSAYMLWWLYNEWHDRDNWQKIVVFANTGKEVEGTLFFVDECSQEWGIPIVWVESISSEKGKGWAVSHKEVIYETASRNGEPFELMISKLGIPRQDEPFCSKQLKTLAIESYLKSIGWNDYYRAIGIRVDENRIVDDYKQKKYIYPLVHLNPVNKRQISEWWMKQHFDLNIHPDDGNCNNCWKKDFPRLVRNMVRNPKSFEWWSEMELKYSFYNPRNNTLNPPFNFYRGNKSVLDIKKMAEMSQAELKQLSMFETLDGCNESCEAF